MDIFGIIVCVVVYLCFGSVLGLLIDGGGWTTLVFTLFWPVFLVAVIVCLLLGLFD